MDALSWFALGIIIFVILALTYGIIAIHDIPYQIAKKRNHPHAAAIHTAGWISLLVLHVIWPFLWIWATAYDPEVGYSGKRTEPESGDANDRAEIDAIKERLAALEARIPSNSDSPPA